MNINRIVSNKSQKKKKGKKWKLKDSPKERETTFTWRHTYTCVVWT